MSEPEPDLRVSAPDCWSNSGMRLVLECVNGAGKVRWGCHRYAAGEGGSDGHGHDGRAPELHTRGKRAWRVKSQRPGSIACG